MAALHGLDVRQPRLAARQEVRPYGDSGLRDGMVKILLEVGAEPTTSCPTTPTSRGQAGREALAQPLRRERQGPSGNDLWHHAQPVLHRDKPDFPDRQLLRRGTSSATPAAKGEEFEVPLIRIGFPIFDCRHYAAPRHQPSANEGMMSVVTQLTNVIPERFRSGKPRHGTTDSQLRPGALIRTTGGGRSPRPPVRRRVTWPTSRSGRPKAVV